MQKVYLLLRNNIQTGPFSLEEVVALKLKSQDLIWEEGKSNGWAYPSEIEILKPYVAEPLSLQEDKLPSKPDQNGLIITIGKPKNVFVSMPPNNRDTANTSSCAEDPFEKKAEALRRRALSFTPSKLNNDIVNTGIIEAPSVAPNGSRKYLQKINRTVWKRKHLIVAATVLVVVISGSWAVMALLNKEPVAAHKVVALQAYNIPQAPDETIHINENEEGNIVNREPNEKAIQKKILETKKKWESKDNNIIAANKDASLPPIVPTPEPELLIVAPTAESNPGPIENSSQKKKSFKESVNDLFKKKNDRGVLVDSAINQKNDARKAQHRAEVSEEDQAAIDLTQQVQLRSNQTSENWMMGVQGLKLTVINRSNNYLRSATVEVIYYNEQNEMLDKKILTSSHIDPKKSSVLIVPDNRLADHAAYKLLSATGSAEGYVKN